MMKPRAYTINEFISVFKIGRSHLYDLIDAGEIKAVKSGRRTLITAEEGERWLASLPAYKKGRVIIPRG